MKTTALFILFLFTCNIYSQDVSMVKSEIFKDSKKNSSLLFSLEDSNGEIITIRSYRGGMMQKLKGYYIQHFDTNLRLLKEVEYDVEDNHIKNAFIKDGQLHLIEFDYKKKEDRIVFNSVSANLDDLKFSKKELISFSEDNMQKYFGAIFFPFFGSNLSQVDRDHMGEVVLSANKAFFVINFDFKDKDKETHKVFVFNSDFEKVFEKLIKKDIKDMLFEYNSIDVDGKDGTVYFLGKSFENDSRRTKKKGKANYHFELFKVNAEGQQQVSFKNADKFISSLELIKGEDRLACVGFYGKKDEFRSNGVCLFNLNSESLEMENQKFTAFSEEFMTDKYGDKENKKKRKKEKGVRNIDFKGVYIMENGDIVVNAEEFYITVYTSMSSTGAMTTRTVYHFDDIISLRLDKDGGLKWARNINKAQTGFANSSFTSIPVGESSYFFINCSDNIKKLSQDRIAFRQTNAKKSNLYMISINKDGAIDFKKLIDDKDSKVYYKVNDGVINLNKQTVTLSGKKKKNTRILKIKI
ncbi:hypothetical protein [Thalassobellus sediminis]|uniref:hypothetical protein n=1 Tax=Thalassobellus sediminis TaxID=3367753 RepID=UPI0037BC287D